MSDFEDIVVDISQEFDLPVDMTTKIIDRVRDDEDTDLLVTAAYRKGKYEERARFKAEVVEAVKNCAAFNSRDRDYAKQELIKDIERL